jgi:hypothetical protein
VPGPYAGEFILHLSIRVFLAVLSNHSLPKSPHPTKANVKTTNTLMEVIDCEMKTLMNSASNQWRIFPAQRYFVSLLVMSDISQNNVNTFLSFFF